MLEVLAPRKHIFVCGPCPACPKISLDPVFRDHSWHGLGEPRG